MQICDKCFCDEEMRTAIRSESEGIDSCDVCGKRSYVVDASFFEDFFNLLFSLFVKNEWGESITAVIQNDWRIFSDADTAQKIIDYYLGISAAGFTLDDKVSYLNEINELILSWED